MAGVGDYLALMKPRVMSLVLFTALVGIVIAPGHLHPVLGFFALGVNLAAEAEGDVLRLPMTPPIATAVLLRLVAAPALLAGMSAIIIGVPGAYLLQAAMPSGINGLVLAHTYGLDLRLTSSALAWTTIVAVLALGSARAADADAGDGAPPLPRRLAPIFRPGQLAAPPGAHLSYFGGRVLSRVELVMVEWGDGVYAPYVTGAESPSLAQFLAAVAGRTSGRPNSASSSG